MKANGYPWKNCAEIAWEEGGPCIFVHPLLTYAHVPLQQEMILRWGFSSCQELALCCVITATPAWSVTVSWYLLWDWQRGHPFVPDLWLPCTHL